MIIIIKLFKIAKIQKLDQSLQLKLINNEHVYFAVEALNNDENNDESDDDSDLCENTHQLLIFSSLNNSRKTHMMSKVFFNFLSINLKV